MPEGPEGFDGAANARRWSCRLENDRIDVEATKRAPHPTRKLLVNGEVIVEETATSARGFVFLGKRTRVEGRERVVEAAFSAVGFVQRCKIIVDGNVVGGDVDVKFLVPEPPLWATLRERGRLRYVVAQLWRPVLMMGGIAVVFGMLAGPHVGVVGFIASVLSAFIEVNSRWDVAERAYRRRERRLADSAWMPPSPEPYRRLGSLVWIAVGIVVSVFSGLALLLFVLFAFDQRAPSVVFPMLVAATLCAAGVACTVHGVRLRALLS